MEELSPDGEQGADNGGVGEAALDPLALTLLNFLCLKTGVRYLGLPAGPPTLLASDYRELTCFLESNVQERGGGGVPGHWALNQD